MEIEIKLTKKAETYRAGMLSINGKFFCWTIEDRDRGLEKGMQLSQIMQIKQRGVTAIPTGKYKVAITYSNRFKTYMPQVLSVPGFEGIRIHVANTARDVEGCIGIAYENSEDGFAGNSRKCYADFIKQLKAVEKKETIWLTIQ